MRVAYICPQCGERSSALGRRLFSTGCPQCGFGSLLSRRGVVLIATLLVCALGGFFAGRYTGSDRTFSFIGTPVAPRGNERQVVAASASPALSVASQHQTETSAGTSNDTCGAPTKSGKPCTRRVSAGGYCWQHRRATTLQD